MLKRMHWIVLIAVLSSVMVFSVAFSSEAGVKNLSDIGEASWAQQEITEMGALDILDGYPDGKFKPYQSVTRLEAIAMLIRVTGLDEQARALENADVDYQIPYLPWGRGYLILAVQQGMLDKNYLNQLEPTGAATRAQVAALACLALGLEDTDSSLDFSDAAQIPAGYRGYVAVLVEKKIMQGLPGNVFEPNGVINRAQMAVLLSNLLNNDLINPYPDRIVTGSLSAIEPISGVIDLQGGTSKFLTAECQYYLDGKKVEAADIKSGDLVRLVLDESGQVVFVRAATSEQEQQDSEQEQRYRGRVDNVFFVGGDCWVAITCLDGTKLTRSSSRDVMVNGQSDQLFLASIRAGEYVEIKLTDNLITEVKVLNTSTVKGRVTDVESSRLTITSSGDETELIVPDGVAVLKEGNAVSYGVIEVGDEVEVTLCEQEAINIVILSNSLQGEIEELDNSEITLMGEDSYRRIYTLDDDVAVIIDGDNEGLGDLSDGDKVRLELDRWNNVTSIEVLESSGNDLEGDIRDLDTTGTYGITIRNSSGDRVTYKVVDDVDVYDGNSELDFDELETGDEVRLELDRDDWVDEIEVINSDQSTEEGIISDLDTGSNPRLWLTNSDDDEERYYISEDVECTRDSDSIDLEDIVIGSEAEIEVEDDEVVTIEITDDEDITIEGEIVDVRESSERIKIEQSSGNQFTYYLEARASLRDRDGDTIELDDVEESWDVELQLRDGEIRRLTRQ